MRPVRFILSFVAIAAALTACQAPSPGPSPVASSSSATPTPQLAAVGESALPLGCADLVDIDELASLGSEIGVQVDENRLAPRLHDVGRIQEGALLCAWGYGGYSGDGAPHGARLAIAPTDDTSFDLAAEAEYYVEPAPVSDTPPTFRASCYGDEHGSYCNTVQLRDGYRVELSVMGLGSTTEQVTAFTADLLEGVGAAIDGAGPAREVATAPTTGNAADVCTDPALAPLLDARGAAGEPEVRETSLSGSPVVTTCVWVTSAPGAEYEESVEVSVLPGGAWAIPALVAGPRIYPLYAEPTTDGSRLVGCGDGCGAFLALGDDLVLVGVSQVDLNPAEWAALVAQIG